MKEKQLTKNKAVALAKKFARNNDYHFISPFNITRKEKTAEIDAIVVGDFGILAVKTLHYEGTVYGNANEEQWLCVNKKGEKEYFKNPITQASIDVRVIRDALFAKNLKQIPLEVVCVFTAKKPDIAVPASVGYYKLKDFKVLLGKEKYQKEMNLKIDKILEALQEAVEN